MITNYGLLQAHGLIFLTYKKIHDAWHKYFLFIDNMKFWSKICIYLRKEMCKIISQLFKLRQHVKGNPRPLQNISKPSFRKSHNSFMPDSPRQSSYWIMNTLKNTEEMGFVHIRASLILWTQLQHSWKESPMNIWIGNLVMSQTT